MLATIKKKTVMNCMDFDVNIDFYFCLAVGRT